MPCSCRRSSRAPATSRVEMLTDPLAVVARCTEAPPDLLLLDWHMPGRSGPEILEEIAFLTDEPNWMPVLVLTADIAPDTKRRALSLGARDFLTKPIDVAEVLLRVRNLLQTRYLRVELQRTQRPAARARPQRTLELEDAKLEMLDRLALAAEYRDDATGQHADRIGRTSELLALELGLERGRGDADRPRGAAARHRQDRHRRRPAAQARQVHGRGDRRRWSCTRRSARASSRAATTSC